MAGDEDAILALDQQRMEATGKQDVAMREPINADVGGPDQGTVTKKLAESPESAGRGT